MKTFSLLVILGFAVSTSYAQEKPTTSGKQGNVSATQKQVQTINAESVPELKLKEAALSPEEKATKKLNTTTIPVDFPRFQSGKETELDYETRVSEWFKNHPDKLRKND